MVVERHVAITLEVGHAVWYAWGIDRELLVVHTNTVAMGIWVREETALQDRIGRRLNSWRHVCRVESNLLNLCKVVRDILVQEELAHLAEGELLVWPDMRQVENIDLLLLPEVLCLLGSACLHTHIPAREVAVLDGVEQILLVVVGRVVVGLLLGDETSALLGLEVDLCIHPFTLLVHELHRVATVTVHLSPVLRDTTVTHEDHDLMDRLGVLGKVVPEHGRVISTRQVVGWVTLLGVDEVRELGWVSQEEDGGVVGDHVPVALLSAELDRETTGVSGTVMRAGLATNGGESNADGALLAGLEEVCNAEVVERVGGLVVTMCTATLGVYNTLGDTLAVKVGKKVDQMEILQKQRSVLADTLCLVWVWHAALDVRS